MRLFVAINFDEQTKRSIQKVQNSIKSQASGNFTLPENFHLTLVFVGEVDMKRLSALKDAISRLKIPRLNLVFERTGSFKRNDGDICWIGLRENEVLSQLQSRLYDSIEKAGFKLQNNSFKPHITLARRVKPHLHIDRLLESPFTAATDSISLMLSEHINGKLVYTELFRHPSSA